MAIIKLDKDKSFYMDKRLKMNIDIMIHCMRIHEMDGVLVIDGAEGAGKSKLARQISAYIAQKTNSKYGTDQIHFDLEEYMMASLKGEIFTINHLDESRKILNRKRALGKEAVEFTNYLSECRSKRQVHIILAPAFHDIDSYIVKWRMSFCIHVLKKFIKVDSELGWDLKKGDYVIFDRKQLVPFHEFRHLKYKYPEYEPTDICQFKNVEALKDINEYNEKKDFFTNKKYMAIFEDKNKVDAAKQKKEDFKERNKNLVEDRLAGMAYKDIARKYSISTTRASVLFGENK